jgi:hypothetical protein
MGRVFADAQVAVMRACLNRLIPAEGDFPGAGDLELVDHLDRVAAASTATRRMFAEGVRAIELESERRHTRAFAELDGPAQDAVLEGVERTHPLFFEALVCAVYGAYYSHPAVIEQLGLEVRAPQPLGHALAQFPAAITEAIGKRPAFYRPA